MKTVIISNKEYSIDCNAFTYVKYKQIFNIGIFEDIQKIEAFTAMQTINRQNIFETRSDINDEEMEKEMGALMMPLLDEFVSSITRIAWILIYSANERIEEYEKWLKSIADFKINDEWIVEVTKFVVECFR